MYWNDYIWFITAMLFCTLFSAIASGKVHSAFSKYSKVRCRSGKTGYDTVAQLLWSNRVNGISVGRVKGNLSDHYDPRRGVVNLSESTYGNSSVASVAVAAHEMGHVMQKQEGYWFYRFRTALVSVVNFGSRLAFPLVLIGLLLDAFVISADPEMGFHIAMIGVILYGTSFLFTLVTLPVEINASRRAGKMLLQEGILTTDEMPGAKKVLSAAALHLPGFTYDFSRLFSALFPLCFNLIRQTQRQDVTGGGKRDYRMSNILLLDRNIDEAERISSYFEARSYAVIWPKTIADLLYHVVHRDFCLAILDVALSAEDDHRFLDALRKVKGVPILVLGSDTADAEERLNSLRAGAHAYLCRPYSMEECFAQAQALIQAYSPHMQTRKEENSSCKMTVAGRLRISPESRQAFLGEKEIMLTRKEFDLLLLFAENPNKVFTCDQLYDLLWSEQTAYNVDEVVKAHIKSLRQKLSDDDSVQIKNVWGVGYRFCYNRK